VPIIAVMEATAMDKREIAVHITQECTGDNCPCCDWSDEDRAVLETMTIVEACALAYGEGGN
jgi:hypothetical protein